ncbi:hypothetical protein [Alkalihalobacillus trypoxylicola]|uniref:ATP-dependent DNA ligase family profile domain-containing protein n=1 Tax=Alkalihalobacillus trypoxylicola TaxID=519424 RepID=A0A162FC01_9BACI|nr:hypothetical protein [Alkalihalobacillus trypoxylicola]KYG35250.1 hypothetical protein AZF04_02615 [Alkalihalobacillus trypoxylicola]
MDFVKPMLLETKSDGKPSDDDSYINELKLDGFRLIACFDQIKKFYTRNGQEVSHIFPELQEISLRNKTILDGEIIVTNEEGRPDFEELMRSFHSRKKEKIKVQYVVFDVLMVDGNPTYHQTLLERKRMLDHLIPVNTSTMAKIDYLPGNGEALFQVVKNKDLEGIVQKEKFSKYLPGKRSLNWLKVIHYQETIVMIIGYRKKELSWLVTYQDGTPAGLMDAGVPNKAKMIFYQLTQSMKKVEDKNMVYIEQEVACVVKYRTKTSKGHLRHPIFKNFVETSLQF